MPIVINGSTGISGTDGSASTPAIQGSDTNTGMFFPAADTIAFAEGGTEVMRIDSSGSVGIGTSTPIRRLTLTQAGSPEFVIQDTSQGTDLKNWRIFNTGSLIIGTLNDAGTSGTDSLILDRSSNLRFNSGYGSVAVAYGCRAWVNFNGTGIVAMRNNGNVSSITDNGTGDYTVNFATAMPDANYCFIGTSSDPNDDSVGPVAVGMKSSTYVPTTTSRRFETTFNGTNLDSNFVSIAVFR